MFYFWGIAQGLKIGGELDGGLTRTNFITALRVLEMTHPWLLHGIRFNLNGNADAQFVEGSEIAQWSAAQQSWMREGSVIDLSGKSKNCAWDFTTASCK